MARSPAQTRQAEANRRAQEPYAYPMLSAFLLVTLSGLGPLCAPPHQDPVLPEVQRETPSIPKNADGTPLQRGKLPKHTSEEAKQRFQRMPRSTWTGESAPKGLRSFMVTFDARIRSSGTGSNDMRTTFLFLEEGRGYIRGIFPKSRRESVRGPEGDWLLDGEELLDLSDHSNKESRLEHERWLALARNFATLSSPNQLRLGRLESIHAEGEGTALSIGGGLRIEFPTQAQAKRAQSLDWLLMTTPDFNLLSPMDKSAALRRVRLGLDRNTGRIRFALIEGQEGHGEPPAAEDPILVEIPSWIEFGDRRLPQQVLVHRVPRPQDPASPFPPQREPTSLLFEELPSVDLYLVKNQSEPDVALTKEDFSRPKPR